MPDFNKLKPKTCLKTEASSATKAAPFELSTINRGEEKRAKLLQQVEEERLHALELTKFKAREFKPQDLNQQRAVSVGGNSGKNTPSATLMAAVKEFKLHSLMRNQHR